MMFYLSPEEGSFFKRAFYLIAYFLHLMAIYRWFKGDASEFLIDAGLTIVLLMLARWIKSITI